jgi:hypothetical protein
MGVAQGQSLAGSIRATVEVLRDLEAFRLKQPRWLPFPWFRRIAARAARRSVAPAVARSCPDAYERVRGIASGSEVAEGSLWLLNAMEGLLGSVKGNTVIPPPCGCTAIAIRGRLSAGGEPAIAHNFDYLPRIQPYHVIRESRPSGRYRSLEFTAAPLAGALDGVNEKGLAVTYNYAWTTDEGKPAPTLSMLISEVLASCETVDEAVGRFRARPRWGSGLLMLADREGDMASVELANTQTEVRRAQGGEDFLFHTNKFKCERTVAVEVPADAVYNSRSPVALRGQRVLESPLKRDERLAELLGESGPLDLGALGALMADHGADGQPSGTTVCMHGEYWVTTTCVQCLPRSRALRVSYSTACQAKFVEFAL